MKRNRTLWCCPLVLAAVAAAQAASVGTAFTYQGRLTDNGAPASGTHNFVFRLCSGNVCNAADVLATYPSAGTVPVSITNGLFTVPVDFGANMFMTDARWLEIVVDGTTLCPRQELTPTPFALALPGLWTQQNATSPNIIGGQVANSVTAGVVGATISGGGAGGASNNRATDNYTTVGGGADNQAGNNNANLTDATYASAAGGSGNNATGSYTSIGGGRANVASQAYGTVGGGRSNNVSGQYGTIAGGGTSDPNLTSTSNRVSDSYGTVAGGGNNRAGDGAGTSSDKPYASVGGGEDNQANGMHSTIPGGQSNRANGTGSFAAGRQAQALHDGAFVWSDGTAAFASTATNQFLVRASNGMGIGVAPGAGEMLSVGGLVESTSGGFKFPDGTTQTTAAGSSLWTASGTNIYNANSGYVGVGTASPASRLHVLGEAQSLTLEGLTHTYIEWYPDGFAAGRKAWMGFGGATDNDFTIRNETSGADILLLPTSGNVGVGTSTPGAALDVVGAGTYALRSVNSSASGYGLYAQHSAATGSTPAIYGQTDSTSGSAFAMHGRVSPTSAGSFSAAVRGENLSTTAFGIGVWGSQSGSGYGVFGTTVGGLGVYGSATSGTGVYGSSSSGTAMRAEGGGVGINNAALFVENTNANGIAINAENNSTDGTVVVTQNGTGSLIRAFNGGCCPVFEVLNSGETVVPVLQITGADLAERFATSEQVEPGMVVEIDPDQTGQLRLSRSAYNRRVAGVVSGAGDLPAGAILGNLPGHKDAPPIALSGRVWVRCDASSGAIEPGDLLTTSDTLGHAMKLEDYGRGQGAIIGKAMSRLEKGGAGLVLVLVNLQ